MTREDVRAMDSNSALRALCVAGMSGDVLDLEPKGVAARLATAAKYSGRIESSV